MNASEFLHEIFSIAKKPSIVLSHFWETRKSNEKVETVQGAMNRIAKTKGADQYFRVGVVHGELKDFGRGTADDASEIVCFVADFDLKDEIYDRESCLTYLHGLSSPPSIIVWSGGGYHAYWLLDEPWDVCDVVSREEAKKIMKGWTNRAIFGADSSRSDLASILRVPDTENFKRWKDEDVETHPGVIVGERKYSKEDRMCRVIEWTGIRYDRKTLCGMIPEEPVKEPSRSVDLSSVKNADRRIQGRIKKMIEGIASDISGAKEGDRNKMLTRKCAKLGDMVVGGLIEESFAVAVASTACVSLGIGAGEKSESNILRLVRRGGKSPITIESIASSFPAEVVKNFPVSAETTENVPSLIKEEEDPVVNQIAHEKLPSIGIGILPYWAADFVFELSRAKEVDPTFGTLLCLSAIASTVQRRFHIRVEASYVESLCIFTAPCMSPGERKTAIQTQIVKPLLMVEREYKIAAEEEEKRNGNTRRLKEGRIKKMELEYHKAEDENEMRNIQEEIEAEMAKIPKPLPMPQLIVESFTEAALCESLRGNGESLFATSSEGGIFSDLCGRFSDRPEMDLVLKSHTGETYRSNRIGRGKCVIDRPLLSVGISPQPGVLSSLSDVSDIFFKGLAARFAWAFPVSMVGNRSLQPASVPPMLQDEYTSSLAKMARDSIKHEGESEALVFTEEAHREWKEFEKEIEPRMAKGGDLSDDKIKAWASKLPGFVARVSGISHCAVFFDSSVCAETPVSVEFVKQAVMMARALIPHTKMAFGLLSDTAPGVAESVVEHYEKNGWPKSPINRTEWWRPMRSHIRSSRDFAPICEKLVDAGYLIPVSSPDVAAHGKFYRANRRLFK